MSVKSYLTSWKSIKIVINDYITPLRQSRNWYTTIPITKRLQKNRIRLIRNEPLTSKKENKWSFQWNSKEIQLGWIKRCYYFQLIALNFSFERLINTLERIDIG